MLDDMELLLQTQNWNNVYLSLLTIYLLRLYEDTSFDIVALMIFNPTDLGATKFVWNQNLRRPHTRTGTSISGENKGFSKESNDKI